MVKKLDKIVSGISGTVSIVSYVCLVGIMLLMTVDVFMRKLFDAAIVGSYEIVERLLLLLVFAAFAYAQTNKAHIHVTMFVSKLPRGISLGVFGFWNLISTATAIVCGYALCLQGAYALEAGTWTPVLYIPLFPFFYIAAVGMFIFALTLLWDTAKCFIGIGDKEVGDEIRSHWD